MSLTVKREHMKKERIISDYLLNTIENTLCQLSTLNLCICYPCLVRLTDGLLKTAGPRAAVEDAPSRYAIASYQTSTKFNPESILHYGSLIDFIIFLPCTVTTGVDHIAVLADSSKFNHWWFI